MALERHLVDAGHSVFLTREPGAGALGQEIRRLLLEGETMPQLSELFLFLADRAHHIANLVRPALAEGQIVICDRHADSTVVYQGHARGLDLGRLRELNHWATEGLEPAITLLLDLPAEIGLARVQERNRLDNESIDFHRCVREGFLAEAQLAPHRFVVLDASQSPEEVVAGAWKALGSALAKPPL